MDFSMMWCRGQLEKCKKQVGKYKYVLVVLGAGLLLLCVGTPAPTPPTPETDPPAPTETTFSAQAFEEDLTRTLACIQGIGEVQVMATLADDGERVYATDARTSDTSDERTIATMSDGNYGQAPIERYATYPSFRGVVVVCQGAGVDRVKLAVMQAVTALCDIDTTQVTILPMG